VLELGDLDLDEIASALGDQTDYEHRWLINPQTGEITIWTSDPGIDGQNPVDLDELDLVCIDPLPSYVWYQDMADVAERISDDRAGRRLARAGRAGHLRRGPGGAGARGGGAGSWWGAARGGGHRRTRSRTYGRWLATETSCDRSFAVVGSDPVYQEVARINVV
jgi:hypothetical protein